MLVTSRVVLFSNVELKFEGFRSAGDLVKFLDWYTGDLDL